MNDNQRWLVIAALVVIGLVLAFIMLRWDAQAYDCGSIVSIVTFHEALKTPYSFVARHGIYTHQGVAAG